MYTELPLIETSTPADRLQALKDAKDLMSKENATGLMAAFGAPTKSDPGSAVPVIDGFIRLAEYITTGHDYKDTHPEGKRRPIIKNTHVTVMAPVGASEGLEHLLSHINDGSFGEFLDDMIKDQSKPETADDEKSADKAPDEKPFEL